MKKLNEELKKLLNEIYGDYAWDVKIDHPFITGAELFYVEDYENRPFTQRDKAYLPKTEYYKVGITANKDNKGQNIPIYIAEGIMDLEGNWIYPPSISQEVYNIQDTDVKSYIINQFIDFTKSIDMDSLNHTIKDRIA